MIVSIVIVLLSLMLMVPFGLCFIDWFFGTSYSCDVFGWHNGSGGAKYHDGCSFHARCSKCGREVMLDSQGNWFV